MLFTDGPFITVADLTEIDSEALKMATAEGVDIPTVILRSIQEAGSDLKARFQSFGGVLVGNGTNSAHISALMNGVASSVSRPAFRLNQVVVTEPDPTKIDFKRWVLMSALSDLYRTTVMRKTNDRFLVKMDLFAEEALKAWARIKAVGCPIVLSPLPRPGATGEYNPGTWAAANVSAVGSAGSETGHTYDIAITWTGPTYASQTAKNNSESAPSATVSLAVAAGKYIQVSIASVNPPTGQYPQIGTSDGYFPQMQATGWNLYVGLTGQTMFLQNGSPYPIATTSVTMAAAPTLAGYGVGVGQFSDYNYAHQNMLQRA